ncbi:MAG TPA: OsmC family protein [bacterium]|nr:OsmC family protein [bacterium]
MASEVLVKAGPKGLNQQIEAGGHRLLADEPLEAGGTDTGPNPYDLLLAALGACSSMTVRLYADRKGYNLRGIEIKLHHEKVHIKDCQDCESPNSKIDLIQREIKLIGNLSEEERQRLLEIADRCPVARTLQSEIRIESKLVPLSS